MRYIVVFLLICVTFGSVGAVRKKSSGWIFTYFRNNGEDGLHLAASGDGLRWETLRSDKSFLAPVVGSQKLMRDPSVVLGPDGLYHLVWTTGWRGHDIGVAHSKDLINWSEQQAIPVMAHEPTAINCWAPEIAYDKRRREYLIFWATTIPGRFPATEASGNNGLNHRIYATTTKDFRSYTPTRLFYDDGFNVIDSTIIETDGRFAMILKDETQNPVRKNLRLAWSDQLSGPYGKASAPFTSDWVEGPTAIRVGVEWIVYYDMYRDHRYGAVSSRDLKSWKVIDDRISFPEGMRHGTAVEVPQQILDGLRAVR